jgi:cyclic-di-GMP phosphodiesterase TipF (flagellum assembly factor)
VRFALDELVDLRLDPVAQFDRGIRFVKAPAALLMEQVDSETADIAPADLSALLARASIVLVADQVADDPTVADMIDLGVGMGQGPVFSPPRPVKPDVFAEPAEPAPAAAEPSPSPAPAPEQRLAEVVDYPGQPAATREAPPERQSFRSVLRRATA